LSTNPAVELQAPTAAQTEAAAAAAAAAAFVVQQQQKAPQPLLQRVWLSQLPARSKQQLKPWQLEHTASGSIWTQMWFHRWQQVQQQ
jgi:hypothetical protein